ncbi:MAG TPA: efflux RND transporter periplasmic adaptor subunit [Gemmatimonadaceae bacterium]|nr:efflux RND transporter periplasmic adaptor subunit [Gemmatimonadaceae bacterium]
MAARTGRARKMIIAGVVVAAISTAIYFGARPPSTLVLTGIVTTNEVMVSPMVTGQIGSLLVKEGDQVTSGQLLGVLGAGELSADRAFYQRSEQGSAEQVTESEAALRYQEEQTTDQINQADASLGALVAQRAEVAANLSNAKATLDRDEALLTGGGISAQDVETVRTAYAVAKSRSDALDKQIAAAQAAVGLAQSAAQQVAAKRSAFSAAQQQHAAAAAQTAKANVRLGYADLRSPINGIVDVVAARQGEVVNAGQPVVTIINPDDLWVRADVEESYIDRIRLGDSLTVRLPSGEERRGAVFYRGVDAAYATQRDVSRTKRDIKTFEIRIRVDNHDRRLAVGMTAYVLLPVGT